MTPCIPWHNLIISVLSCQCIPMHTLWWTQLKSMNLLLKIDSAVFSIYLSQNSLKKYITAFKCNFENTNITSMHIQNYTWFLELLSKEFSQNTVISHANQFFKRDQFLQNIKFNCYTDMHIFILISLKFITFRAVFKLFNHQPSAYWVCS